MSSYTPSAPSAYQRAWRSSKRTHVHFVQRKWANAQAIPAAELSEQMQSMLTRWGFTSVFDIGSDWENTRQLRNRIESGEIPGPCIRSTGVILFPKGGAPEPRILDVVGTMRIQFPEVTEPAEASAAAKKLLDAGTDGIKMVARDGVEPPTPAFSDAQPTYLLGS
jgi:hypothetical protein